MQQETEYKKRANAVAEARKRWLVGVLTLAMICLITSISLISRKVNKPLSNGMPKDEGDKIFDQGTAYYNEGNYGSAMECFQKLPTDSKQYEKAQSMLLKSKDAYRSEILQQIDSYIGTGEFDVAFNLIEQAKEILPEDSDLQAAYGKIYSAYKNLVLEQAASYTEDEDYVQAISAIESAVEKIGQDGELVAKLNTYKDIYRNGILQQLEGLYDTDGYEAVMSLLKQAKSVLSDDGDLAEEYSLWESRRPVLLTEMEEYSNDGLSVNDTNYNTDNYGTNYTSSIAPTSAFVGSTHYIEYYLDSRYTQLKAVLYITEGTRYLLDDEVVSVYGDDVLLCEYSGFSYKDKPKEIVIDVSDVEFLMIKFTRCNMNPWGEPDVVIANPTVSW